MAVIPDARAVHASGTGSGDPADPTVAEIKGREARRAHVLLLRRHRSERAADPPTSPGWRGCCGPAA